MSLSEFQSRGGHVAIRVMKPGVALPGTRVHRVWGEGRHRASTFIDAKVREPSTLVN
jgi:hypothetical protein